MGKFICGVDLGGTKISTGIMDLHGNVLKRIKMPTNAAEGPMAAIERINKSIISVMEMAKVEIKDIKGIGIGSPGPLDSEKGIIEYSANLPGWRDVHIVDEVHKEFGIPVMINNDANVAALAEYRFGAGRGTKNFVYITLSTGIGGGIVINSRLYNGANTNAGEIGHMTIDLNGPKCGCGNYGCFEALASGTAISRFARNLIERGENTQIKALSDSAQVKAEDVFEAAKKGDRLALNIIDKEAFYLGTGIANIINLYNPERIALGGGVSTQMDMFYEKMMDTIKNRALKPNVNVCSIVRAELGGDIGIIGAASLFL